MIAQFLQILIHLKRINATFRNAKFRIIPFFLLITPFIQANQAPATDNILILHSYHQGLQWTDNINEGIIDEIKAQDESNFSIYVEYLDLKRQNSKTYIDQLSKLLHSKFSHSNIKVIITSDDLAFKYAINNRKKLFNNAPVVFCGVNHFNDYKNTLLDTVTNYYGVIEGFNLKSTIETALHNHPNATQVLIINDETPTGIANKKALDEILPILDSSIRFEYSQLFDLQKANEYLSAFDKNTIILLLSYNRDVLGNYYSYKECGNLIRNATELPIYVVWDFYLPSNVVGGMVVSGYWQGKTAAKTAFKVINNSVDKQNPVLQESPNKYMFNYSELERLHIEQRLLPHTSIILNKPISFIDKYLKELIVAVSLMMVLLIAVISLLFINRKKTIAEQKLFHSRNKLSTIIETANQGFIEFNFQGVIININHEACKIFELDRYIIINKSIDTLLKLNDFQFDKRHIHECFSGESIEVEIKIATKNKKTKFLLISGTPIFSPDNTQVVGAFALITDITNRKIYEQEILKSKNRAEQADKLKSAFLANMSHEIRTPMNAILGFSELLELDELASEQRKVYLQTIQKSGHRLLGLINDILDLSKIEAGQITIESKNVNINEILHDLLITFNKTKITSSNKNITLNLIPLNKHITIKTDELRLSQILTNLIDNALKFTKEGFIEFGCYRMEKSTLSFYVKDSGIGISKEQQSSIFERFRKIESGEMNFQHGAGLGLAITRNLVNLLGGEIWLESEPNKGSTFYFTISGSIRMHKIVESNNL